MKKKPADFKRGAYICWEGSVQIFLLKWLFNQLKQFFESICKIAEGKININQRRKSQVK